ncbi:MAG: hypothetical protein KatS3mg052_0794 [Candidatus Roseilinea sp.]|nr:MAG: hypothetical protein KatS3mg052_0794 [Candidatus Roseilinea sp.]
MRNIPWLLLLTTLLLLAACQPAAPTPTEAAPGAQVPAVTAAAPVEGAAAPTSSAPLQTHTYPPLAGDVVNPERGFRYSFDTFEPAQENYSTYRLLGTSLVYVGVRLDNYREQDLPQALLDSLDQAFAAVRQGGIKVVLRFQYNEGPWPNSEPDASLEQVLRHIAQLKPILQKNTDVIAWTHAGFIGAWGEWHSSTHGLNNDPAAKRAILEALADALPQRPILLRYPPDLMNLFPEPLTAEQAFSDTLQARLGFHNDCFLSSDTDVGTYSGGSNSRENATRYLSQITQFVPTSGETCAVYPPLQACDVAIREMEKLHWTDLNLSYHQQVIKNWKKAGCFEEIQRRLGYRLVLQEATFPSAARPGEVLPLTWKLVNEGFASPLNPRLLFVVLDGPTTVSLPVSEVDPRTWLPGEHSVNVSVPLPADLPTGEYRLALWLPDPAESLRNDPRYSIRFANAEIWDEAKGLNVLGALKVNP